MKRFTKIGLLIFAMEIWPAAILILPDVIQAEKNPIQLDLNIENDAIKAEAACPSSSNGCLIKSENGQLTIYIKDFGSSEIADVSLFGLMFDAYQLQEYGNVNYLKTCRMKLAYAKENKFRKASNILNQKC